MKNTKRFIAMIMLVVVVFGTMSFASASVWRTGDFTRSGWTTYHTVYFSNRNAQGVVNLYTYACSKGTGHSGSCNNKAVPNGTVTVQLRNGSNNQMIGNFAYNARYVKQFRFNGYNSVKIRFAGTTRYQHWGIEGVSNVRSIS